MGLFGKGNGGGLMNVIRCDQEEYLVWKWRPEGQETNSTSRENSIRYGSSLRVKDGEVAVFVYKQETGVMQDFIEGPFDETIKTQNFPVLASIVGMAFGGESPFQAEVYFINLKGNNQMRFAVPYFDMFDPRLPDHGVPVAVRGTLTFNISDYRNFIKLNRLINFDIEQFCQQIKDAVVANVKGVVTNIPRTMNIPLVQMETQLMGINSMVHQNLQPRIEKDFGVRFKAFDIATIDIDKESPTYAELRRLTAENTARTMQTQVDLNLENLQETQAMNLENMRETLRIQREETQRAQRLQTEQANLGAHGIDVQAGVLKEGVQNLGHMGGTINFGGSGGEGEGMNPASMMTGMMMGGAIGKQMAGMMNGMGEAMNNPTHQANTPASGAPNLTPPPLPTTQFYTAQGGQQQGPFTLPQMQQAAQAGGLSEDTLVWKQGMSAWTPAKDVAELHSLFVPPIPVQGAVPPPIPTL